ncbi:MAG TPA: helix-turn-helix domain-containing protein [Ktedonobacterales bacterium]|nr:helix-turn-helix domain-containing protein [Ktedonobacterales bacterium]
MGIEGSVAVRELLPLLRGWQAQVIAGANGLGRAVTWANTMRPRLPAFEGLRPGDLAILSLNVLHSFNTQAPLTLSGAIEQLSEMGAAAVIVVGLVSGSGAEASSQRLSGKLVDLDDVRRRADERALPVVALAADVAPAEVERAVIAYVVEHRQRGAADALRVGLRNETLDALLTGSYVGEAQMRTRAAQLGYDLAHPYVALWVEVVEEQATRRERASAPDASAREAQTSWAGTAGRADHLAETLTVILGAWARVRPSGRPNSVSGDGAAKERASRVGEETTGMGEPLPPHESAWLRALIAGDRSLHEANLGISADPVQARRQLMVSQVVALLPLARGERHGERDATSVVPPGTSARQGESYAGLSERLGMLLTRTLGVPSIAAPGSLWIAGVGASATAPSQARRSADEARDAARLGATIFGPGRVTRPADLGVYRLLLAIRQSGELEAFVQQTLAPLQTEGRTGEALIETLEAFFACNGNLSEAARRLSLHRNSLLYRLSRARELLGHDLDDSELRLSLQLAIKSQRVLRLLEW